MALVLFALATACPLTAPVLERSEHNVGPFVDINLIEPYPGRQVSIVRGEGPVRFNIPYIEDSNVDDVIVARGFVNYHHSAMLWWHQTIPPTGEILRPGPSFELDICQNQQLSNLNEIFVEVDLSDREFLTTGGWRAVPDDAKVLTIVWRLVPEPATVCPPMGAGGGL